MEHRLIDGLSLWAEMKRLEELARDRYLDTPSSSPAHTRYCEQMQERTRLKEMVSATPTIDPVHAAGACYCRECNHCLIDLSERKYHLCMRERMQRRVQLDDFCSYGERSDQNA